MNYLTEEEQYKETLNQEEINRIKDDEFKEIRQKFFRMIIKAHLDEENIPDEKYVKLFDKIKNQEMKEIQEYKIRKNKV